MGVVVVVVIVSIRTSLFTAKASLLLSPSGASWWPWSLPGQKMANCSHRTSLFTAKALAPRGGKKKKGGDDKKKKVMVTKIKRWW